MKLRIIKLDVSTRQSTELIEFARSVTFIFGPVGTGKSTIARLIDYCLGGTMERTPAIQQEFVSATLTLELGTYHCQLERSATDRQSVRVSWTNEGDIFGSVNAPIAASDVAILNDDVYNLSDLLFHLGGVTPIKVRQRMRDPNSPLIRLSFRDIWWYCYLDQTELDSSFFHLEEPFVSRKSQDVMRFFTGLHSERLSELEIELERTLNVQHGNREAVQQIREFMARFELGSEVDLADQINQNQQELARAKSVRHQLEESRESELHPTDGLREKLRELGATISQYVAAIGETEESIAEQESLRAELITSKIKASRNEHASRVLHGAEFNRCPQCGAQISSRNTESDSCRLCQSPIGESNDNLGTELEVIRRELNDRIDQISESVGRRKRALGQSKRRLSVLRSRKSQLDMELESALSRYDSAFVESVRRIDREIAAFEERHRFLEKLLEMPSAIDELEEQAGALQGRIDRIRNAVDDERSRLRQADERVAVIAKHFKEILLRVGFPGISVEDRVSINPRNWRPIIEHGQQEWSFWDAGSAGKKTLFNVCYALAVHAASLESDMPMPSILIIDSPTKNISEDENPILVRSLYREIFRFALSEEQNGTQMLLIDSDLVQPEIETSHFASRRMAGESDAPSLISYYEGP